MNIVCMYQIVTSLVTRKPYTMQESFT